MKTVENHGKKWPFVEELKKPLHTNIAWERTEKKQNEVSLKKGVIPDFRFPDPEKVLETAYADFNRFLGAGNIAVGRGFRMTTEKIKAGIFEAFRVEISEDSCRIIAGDAEGIRRALIFIEDEILRTGGPFLPIKTFEREPLIRTRISRCFFGPTSETKTDELADDLDYYPEEYLNRLAHEGINGLWLAFRFKDLCPSRLFPEHGGDSERRLRKLRDVVGRCRRYGIKIYMLCKDPVGFGDGNLLPAEHLKEHPELGGHFSSTPGRRCFCTSTEKGREYVEEAVYSIFSKVPGLGGLISINVGERPTNCYSEFWEKGIWENTCPRCSKRRPWEVLSELFESFAKGMHRAAPDAEFIAWPYVPCIDDYGRGIEDKKEILRQIAAHTPKDVIFQLNFESNGTFEQLGRKRTVLDYSLAWPGPGDLFEDCARNAIKAGAKASAKIQTGCSHEVATVPFLPVPGSLYRKYKAMHQLGVTAVMQCWYFGNYPGIMNKAAGELSFAPFFGSEDEFLFYLAKPVWGRSAEKAVKAWNYFQEAYSNFPASLTFSWFGPVHNSVVWPLYLKPADKPISPSWSFGFPLKSGDRIGECVGYTHTLDEILTLLEKMSDLWNRGVKILETAEYAGNEERMLDIGLSKALGIQFKSTLNVFQFYNLREKLPFMKKMKQFTILEKMKAIVRDEIKNDIELKELCLRDTRLGYHSEAGGFKYSPDELDWRVGILEKLLREDFEEVVAGIEKGEKLFPEYTGVSPQGGKYICPSIKDEAGWEEFDDGNVRWKAWHDERTIYFELNAPETYVGKEGFAVKIEPRRLWPAWEFVYRNGERYLYDNRVNHDNRWTAEVSADNGEMSALFSIPFDYFDEYRNETGAMRINVTCGKLSWIKKNPWPPRLSFSTDNPADLGWLIFN